MSSLQDDINNITNNVKKDFNIIKIHRNYIIAILVIVTVAVFLYLFRGCQHQKDIDNLIRNVSSYSDSAKHYKNKYGEISYNKTLQFENQKQLNSYLSQHNDTLKKLLEGFKKINTVTVIKEKIVIHDTVPIPFKVNIPCDFDPIVVKRDCTYYNFKGTIFPNKFTIDTILIPNKQSIVFGEKKLGLFRKEYRAEIINSNPYLQTTNIGAFTINPKKQWYQKPFVTFLVGTAFGSAISTAIYIKK